jgi:hypothetical protein
MGHINFFSTLSCIQNQIDELRDAIRWCGQGNPEGRGVAPSGLRRALCATEAWTGLRHRCHVLNCFIADRISRRYATMRQ